jgi:hypothetical protein
MKNKLLFLLIIMILITGCGADKKNNSDQSSPVAQQERFINQYNQTKYVIEENTITSGTSDTGKYFKVKVKQVQNGKVIKSNEWSFSKWKDDSWRYRTDEMKGNTSIVYNSIVFEECMKRLGWTYVKKDGYYH